MMISIDSLPSCYISGVKVFISHQRNDEHIALDVQKRLKKMQIESFLDATDKGRAGYKSVTDWIVANLRKSTHMLVVYTNNTKSSEWVPFEIGMAYEREEGIAVFTPQQINDVPIYLREFPCLNNYESLETFAYLCKEYPRNRKNESTRVYSRTGMNENYARFFIDELKRNLR